MILGNLKVGSVSIPEFSRKEAFIVIVTSESTFIYHEFSRLNLGEHSGLKVKVARVKNDS